MLCDLSGMHARRTASRWNQKFHEIALSVEARPALHGQLDRIGCGEAS